MAVKGVWEKICDDNAGQMTVELVVAFPVLIAVAFVLMNALFFFSECSAFDRAVRNAVRVHCVVPAFGESFEQGRSEVAAVLVEGFDRNGMETDVSIEERAVGEVSVCATLRFRPSLFGLGSEVFGISFPALEHSETIVVDPYRPGVLI